LIRKKYRFSLIDTMKQLDNIQLTDAKSLLKQMRIYADMSKKL